MRLSDYRLSYAMQTMLEQMVTGQLSRNHTGFNGATAQGLFKRCLLTDAFEATDLGRAVAAELIARKPKQYALPELGRLIQGLEVLQKYEPNARPYSTQRSRRCLAIQEERFGDITHSDMMLLDDLGWARTGTYEWVF